MGEVFIADATSRYATGKVEGHHVMIDGELYYRVDHYDRLPPFLMSVVSSSDHWMFISSTGGLSAGRHDADHALFPYYTDDILHGCAEATGGKTIIIAARDSRRALWEPLSARYEGLYRTTRNLYKSVYGNKLVFEEVNHDLGLSFSAAWSNSERFGFVRRATVVNLGPEPVEVDVADGLQNLLPHGVTRVFQMQFSTLVDGYKENELEPGTGLGLFRLSAVPADRSEPSEALRATTVWSEGVPVQRRLLSSAQLDRFRREAELDEELLVRGQRGSYFVTARMSLPAGGQQAWSVVADVDQDRAAVAELLQLLRSGTDMRRLLDEDVQRGTRDLVATVASADGLQLTGDKLNSWRHFSNVLFNIMRGGIPYGGYDISRADIKAFLTQASTAVSERHTGFLESLPATVAHGRFLAQAQQQNDQDLERLAHEYLPLGFSRRHGDPSRPWNTFAIELKDEQGHRKLDYEGNWRDIFQNWEALALSFPGYVESMIFKFLDASTADGYNPYRLTRQGFDWEVIREDHPWSYIGYWGDHQVVYLLRLLELSARYHPGTLAHLLTRRVFTYANVPYRIRPYKELLEDPKNTIDWDRDLDAEVRRRAAAMGADGALLPGPDGTPYRANLAEKLLVLVLARLFNYIPEAGLWMNTQRPEWNDANNALVGQGVSMVTLYYLRRFLGFWRDLLAGLDSDEVEVAVDVATAFRRVSGTLEKYIYLLEGPISAADRKHVLDELGQAGSDHRLQLYNAPCSGAMAAVPVRELRAFCDLALRHVDHSVNANRRDDGLYHAYNLMAVEGGGIVVSHLYEMLEGQVAVLSSGALSAAEAADLLDALRRSKLYRADQQSYLLYPDRRLPGFFEKNNIPASALARSSVLSTMIEQDDRRIVVRDVDGVAHFNAAFHNARFLREALAPLTLPDEETDGILALYEEVFDHRSFTGRSGTFYKYEGLGCIYWHMVAKLLLGVKEVIDLAVTDGTDPAVVARLHDHFAAIREGAGPHKSVENYGAIPTDPYSHTPGFAGAQQPGMTGQVKEDILTRSGEMAVSVEGGQLRFRSHLVDPREFVARDVTFRFFDVGGVERTLELPPGALAFTTCQVPVVLNRSGPARTETTWADGSQRTIEGLDLDAQTSASIFERTGEVRQLEVWLDLEG